MFRFFAVCCWLSLAVIQVGRAAVVFYLDPRVSLKNGDVNEAICQVSSNAVCGSLFAFRREEITESVAALTALGDPPPFSQVSRILTTGIRRGTKVLELRTEGDTTTVNFSRDIVGKELDEVRLMSIFKQVKATLWQFGVSGSVRVEAEGKLLSEYLPPVKRDAQTAVGKKPIKQDGIITPSINSLGSKKIALSPGHGIFWNGSVWTTQRPVYCSPLNQEDYHTLEIVQYLDTYLTADGATTKPYRCLNKSFGNHSTGNAWWRMSANYWLQNQGYPCSVYASSTGDCTTGTGGSEINDDIRARPLASDQDGTDIYVSLHSNGFTGDCTGSCPTGTETYYDSTGNQPAASQNLANKVNGAIMAAITGNADATWTCHGTCVKNGNGNYGEIRIPNCPAILTELGFHDSCDRDGDANHLRDNFFRSTCAWGIYKGICDYFGTPPTWAYYSDEVVSNDIPATMTPGQVATVHIAFRNRGVLWNDARLFKLGAVGDADPFAVTRVNVGSEVGPGVIKTFTLTFTAPATPGTYTTDWQMLREGVTWFGATLTKIVTVSGTAGGPSITTQPQGQSVSQGGTANFTVVATGSPPLNYQWRKNGINLSNGGNISGATTSALAISNVQPGDAGNYSVFVSNTNGSVVSADATLVLISGTTIGSYTIDSGNMDSTSRNGSYVAFSACGLNAWYSYGVPGTSNCTVFNRDIRWIPAAPTYGFTGRGYLNASAIVPDTHASATVKFFAVDSGGTDLAGPIIGTINECAYSCTWQTFYNGAVNVSSFRGWRSNTQDDSIPGSGGCNAACGTFAAGYSQMNIKAARWHYINDWACVGGYDSTNVTSTANRSFTWGESGLYLYPAVDTSHGNAITAGLGLNGKTPGRVTTGDCNNTNSLDFKGNANSFGGGDNMDAYGFAWVFTPSGAGPQIMIGSDDGNRVWVNGTLKNDTNATRGLTRDQDNTGAVSLPLGWSRILFKVHNFTSTFKGTVSLRSGNNANLNEPSVNVFDLGGYYSYGIGYEQDAWYPAIYVTNFYGGGNPQPNNNYYGNSTTVTASGTASSSGPVPFWKVMHYEWGYGLSGDTDYTNVSTGTSWSHTQTDVTGHRRFYFFAVSQSGRTSFQNSGQTGGSNWTGGGAGNYMDVYVDNLPPQDPNFTTATAGGTNQINLAWAVPLDQGIGIAPGPSEAADETGNATDNYYRVGDVGVQVYRDGTNVISSWGASGSANDTGLTANTPHAYSLEARDNSSEARGIWHNATGQEGAVTVWTLSVPPITNSITPGSTNPPTGSAVTWNAANGFGAGQVQYYRYAWDTNAAHTWTDTEPQWSSGTIATVPDSAGIWYLHTKGYNGADVANGTFDYAITAVSPPVISIVISGSDAIITWDSVAGKTYRLQYKENLSDLDWTSLVPDVTASGATTSKTDALGPNQRFYRVVVLN